MKALLKIRLKKVMLTPIISIFIYYFNVFASLFVFVFFCATYSTKINKLRDIQYTIGKCLQLESNSLVFPFTFHNLSRIAVISDSLISSSFINYMQQGNLSFIGFAYQSTDEFYDKEEERKNIQLKEIFS